MSLSRIVQRRAYAFTTMTRAYSNIPSFTKPNSALASISPLLRQVERNYSAGSQVKETYVMVPIPMYGVAGNYASALYVPAVKANMLDRVESELKTLMELVNSSPSFRNFIKDLSVPRNTRLEAVREIFEESSFSDITNNFLDKDGLDDSIVLYALRLQCFSVRWLLKYYTFVALLLQAHRFYVDRYGGRKTRLTLVRICVTRK